MEWDYTTMTEKDKNYLKNMQFPFFTVLDKDKFIKNRKDVDDTPIISYRVNPSRSKSISRSSFNSSRKSNSVFRDIASV